MLGDGPLTFQEFIMNEPVPLAVVHDCVLTFLCGRDDAAVFGAHAVNAYAIEPRMTQDVDILSTSAVSLGKELRAHLNEKLHIAIRIRTVRDGIGLRLYQVAKPGNRPLVDIRPVNELPPTQRIQGVLVVTPLEVVAGKVLSCHQRKGKPKSFTDRRDLAHMLLKFPEFKTEEGAVKALLVKRKASDGVLGFWSELVAEEIVPEGEDDKFFA